MVAIAGVSAFHGGRGGSTPDTFVWDQGSRRKQREVDVRVSVDLAMLPAWPSGILEWALGSGAGWLRIWC